MKDRHICVEVGKFMCLREEFIYVQEVNNYGKELNLGET